MYFENGKKTGLEKLYKYGNLKYAMMPIEHIFKQGYGVRFEQSLRIGEWDDGWFMHGTISYKNRDGIYSTFYMDDKGR